MSALTHREQLYSSSRMFKIHFRSAPRPTSFVVNFELARSHMLASNIMAYVSRCAFMVDSSAVSWLIVVHASECSGAVHGETADGSDL